MTSLQPLCDLRDRIYDGDITINDLLYKLDSYMSGKGVGNNCRTTGLFHGGAPAPTQAPIAKRHRVPFVSRNLDPVYTPGTKEWTRRQIAIGFSRDEIINTSQKKMDAAKFDAMLLDQQEKIVDGYAATGIKNAEVIAGQPDVKWSVQEVQAYLTDKRDSDSVMQVAASAAAASGTAGRMTLAQRRANAW